MNQKHLFGIIVLIGLCIRGYIITLPLDILFNRWGSDDLFYYSQIAGNFNQNGFFSFDGVIPTNGFQFLFEFCLVPFGSLLKGKPIVSLYFILIIQIIISTVAVFQLRKLTQELKYNDIISVAICAVFFLSPKLISVIFNGTEAALSFLMLTLSLRSFLWVKQGTKLVLSGLVFGGLILTRIDFSLYLFILFMAGMVDKHSLINWIKVLIVPSLFFLLWITSNYVYFGSILPSSGEAKELILLHIPVNYIRIYLSTFSTALFSESKISIVLTLFTFVGFYTLFKENKKYRNHFYLLLIIAFFSSLLIVSKIGYYRDWYIIIHYCLVIFLVSFGVDFILKRINLKPLLYILPVFISFILWGEAFYSKRKFNGFDTIKTCHQFHQQVESEKSIGAFNAGIIGTYFDKKNIRVFNLDGVVNNEVISYLKQTKLEEYLSLNNINYIIDNRSSIDFFIKTFSNSLQYEVIEVSNSGNHQLVLAKLNFNKEL